MTAVPRAADRISRPARHGVLLLVVLSMLTLFLMLGVALLVKATRSRTAARSFGARTDALEAYTDRAALDPVRVGLEIAVALRRLYPQEWEIDKLDLLLLHKATLEALRSGADADTVLEQSRDGLKEFGRRRQPHLLYP